MISRIFLDISKFRCNILVLIKNYVELIYDIIRQQENLLFRQKSIFLGQLLLELLDPKVFYTIIDLNK